MALLAHHQPQLHLPLFWGDRGTTQQGTINLDMFVAGGGCASLLAHYGGSYPGTRGQTEGIHTGVIVQLLCAASKEGKVTALPAWLTKKLPLLALLRVYFTEWTYHPLL